jgi:tetratricopeptide (TPR) repeat protein
LGVASVIGREFDLELLCVVSGNDVDDALDMLEPAIVAGLVEEVPDAPGQFAFTHALVRSTLAEELLTLRRVRLHQRIGEAIEASAATDRKDHVPELAYHFTEAAPAGDVLKAVDYTMRLADSLAATGEFTTAQEELERALQLLDAAGDPDPKVRFEVLLGLGRIMSGGRDPRDAWPPTEAALELAQRLGSIERMVRTVRFFSNFVSNIVEPRWPMPELLPKVEELLAKVPNDDDASRARLLAARSSLRRQALSDAASLDRAERDAREAVHLAGRDSDPDTVIPAYLALEQVLAGGPRCREALDAAETAAHAAAAVGDTRSWAMAQLRAASDHLQLGNRAAMDNVLAAIDELPIVHHPANVVSRNFSIRRATVAMLEGRFDEAARFTAEVVEDSPLRRFLGFVPQQWIRAQRGQLRPDVMDRVAAEWPQYPALRSGAALVHAERGNLAEARARFEDLARDDFATLNFGSGRPLVLAELAELCAYLDDARRATVLHELLTPYDDQLIVPYYGSVCVGAAARALAQLEAVLGRYDEAQHHYDAAFALEERFSARAFLPRTRYWYARMLQHRDLAHDAEPRPPTPRHCARRNAKPRHAPTPSPCSSRNRNELSRGHIGELSPPVS